MRSRRFRRFREGRIGLLLLGGILPFTRGKALGLALALAIAAIPWLRNSEIAENPELAPMARYELGYVALLSYLTHGDPGATGTAEDPSRGFGSFPILPLLLTSACVHVAGWYYGMMTADVIQAGINFVLFASLFRLMFGKRWAVPVALLVLIGSHEKLAVLCNEWLTQFYATPGAKWILALLLILFIALFCVLPRWRTWSVLPLGTFLSVLVFYLQCDVIFTFRVPRTFSTVSFLLVPLILALAMPRKPSRTFLFFSGIALGLCAQSDLFLAIPVGLLFLIGSVRRVSHLGDYLYVIAGALLALVPWFIQRIWEHPDLPQRLGAAIASGITIHAPRQTLLAMALLGGLLALAVRSDGWRSKRKWLLFGSLPLLLLLSEPLIQLLTGRQVQVFHYFWLIPGMLVFVTAVLLLRLFIRSAGGWEPFRQTAPSGAFAACFVVAAFSLDRLPLKTDPQLAEVLPFIREKAPGQTLGTLSPEVRAVWQLAGGRVLNPDPFATSLSTDELFDRFVALQDLLQPDASEMKEYLSGEGAPFWHLGHYLYKVPEAGKWILPKVQIDRILSSSPSRRYRCDYVVCAVGQSGEFQPRNPGLREVLRTANYVVYEVRKP